MGTEYAFAHPSVAKDTLTIVFLFFASAQNVDKECHFIANWTAPRQRAVACQRGFCACAISVAVKLKVAFMYVCN